MLLIILVIVVLLLYFYLPCGSNCENNKNQNFTPTQPMAEDVMKNIGVFGTSLESAKAKIPWMNVVSYEGIRQLLRNGGSPTISSIMSVL